METGGQPKDPRIDKFWNKYSDILRLFRIPERAIPWYRRHIQTFINDHPNIRLREHTVESVEIWLGNLGRNPQITDWQFQQKVDALRLLFCHFLKLPWGDKFEWDLWFSGAKSLGKDHPTVARSYEMIYKAAENPNNKLGKKHPDLYHKYLISIRIPDYSPNTEKSYLSWINRFLLFHGQKHPYDCG